MDFDEYKRDDDDITTEQEKEILKKQLFKMKNAKYFKER